MTAGGYADTVFGEIQFTSITKVIVGLQLSRATDNTFVVVDQSGTIFGMHAT